MSSSPASALARLSGLFSSRPGRLVLGFLVLLSLLPAPGADDRAPGALPAILIEDALRPLFLLVFGGELLLRGLRLWRERRRSLLSLFSFLLSALAVLSFLPLSRFLGPDLLIAARLCRLGLLLRLVSDVARDVYLILTRREQLQQFALVTMFVGFTSVVTAAVLVQLGVRHNYDTLGDRPADFLSALWWAFRQLESADNLVPNLKGAKLVSLLSLLLTILGVFIISFLIGIGSNVVAQVLRAERRRPVGYTGHTLIVGPVQNAGALVREFVTLYDKNRQLRRIRPREVWDWLRNGGPRPRRHALPRMVLLGPRDEPPGYLFDDMMRWVVYRHGDGADPEALRRAGAASAKRVLLLSSKAGDPDADAITIAALAAVRESNPDCHVFVELQDTKNASLVERVGDQGSFPLDVPRFAGLFLCQHLVVPGVEQLYRELLNEYGSEFYTHVFVDPREIRALTRSSRAEHLSFAALSRIAHEQHRVVLTGVYLERGKDEREQREREREQQACAQPEREQRERAQREHEQRERRNNLVPVSNVALWMNPMVVDRHGPIAGLGGRPGLIPTAHLRGLIGVCANYRPLRRLSHRVAARPLDERAAEQPVGDAALLQALGESKPDMGGLKRILLVGFSPALPALLRELSGFLGDPEVLLVIGNRGDEQPPLAQRLALLGLELDPLADESHPLPGAAGLRIELPQGGNVTIFTHRGQHLSDFAVSCLQQKPPVDAVVFLSEPDAQDRDARTGMRVLRFADALEAGKIPRGPQLHVLAEFLSRAKGERVAALLRNCKDKSLRVTLVSTDQIKEYFLVRSAFVPGVTAIYGELLSRAGQAMIRLQPPADLRGELRFADVREALLPRGIIPLALQLAPQDKEPAALRLNPGPHEVFPASRLSGIYAIAALGDEDPRAQEAPSEDLADWRLAGGGVELGAGG